MKTKTCKLKSCAVKFTPKVQFQAYCSLKCDRVAKEERKTARKHAKVESKPKTKDVTRGDLTKAAQVAFNAYIRHRDKGRTCISCGADDSPINPHQAGHFKTVGAYPELRFNEDNCHAQCKRCNVELSGNIQAYRQFLIDKIGVDRVEELERHREPLKLSSDDLKELARYFRLKIK